jgi:hypothetical protein
VKLVHQSSVFAGQFKQFLQNCGRNSRARGYFCEDCVLKIHIDYPELEPSKKRDIDSHPDSCQKRSKASSSSTTDVQDVSEHLLQTKDNAINTQDVQTQTSVSTVEA